MGSNDTTGPTVRELDEAELAALRQEMAEAGQAMRGTLTARLIRNAIQCRQCGDVIESQSIHDQVKCQCGQASVDGGLAYARRTYRDAGLEELSEYEATPAEDGRLTGSTRLTAPGAMPERTSPPHGDDPGRKDGD